MRIALSVLILGSTSLAHAGKLKADFDCKKVLKDGSKWAIGTEGYRITAESIECTVSSKEHRLLEGSGIVKTTWHKGTILQQGKEHHGSPIGEGPPFQYIFTLDKGVDWDECATDITIPVTVTDTDGKTVFTASKLYRQDCTPVPVSPPVASTPPAGDSATWDGNNKNDIPEDARDLAQQFVDAAVDVDPPTLASLAAKGVKKGKKTLKGKDVYDLGSSTGIKPVTNCDDANKNCHWGPWVTIVKGKKEFWIYSRNESGYGSFWCAVFTKGKTWAWTAVKNYDTGEP